MKSSQEASGQVWATRRTTHLALTTELCGLSPLRFITRLENARECAASDAWMLCEQPVGFVTRRGFSVEAVRSLCTSPFCLRHRLKARLRRKRGVFFVHVKSRPCAIRDSAMGESVSFCLDPNTGTGADASQIRPLRLLYR